MYFWERKNGIRDRDGKSAGCGILVKKEREYGIRTPFQTLKALQIFEHNHNSKPLKMTTSEAHSSPQNC